MARVGYCKHIKYIVKSNSLALLRMQNIGARMEIIRVVMIDTEVKETITVFM